MLNSLFKFGTNFPILVYGELFTDPSYGFLGKLIGKNLNEFEELRNCEVNDFRWKMRVFANKIAQDRKTKL